MPVASPSRLRASADGPLGAGGGPSLPALSDEEFLLFRRMMQERAGIALSDVKRSLVQNRLHRRLTALGLATFGEYYALAMSPEHADELQRCVEALTTNETFFFRHTEHWDFLIGTVLKAWPAGARLRIWSAAASTGEEAYSIAIAALATLTADHSVQVDATDLNHRVLEVARQGIYSPYAVQKIAPAALRRWFQPQEDGQRWRVLDEVRRIVAFRPHNLLGSFSGGPYAVVFCRNVLIYFNEATKRQVLARVADRVAQGGYLILGGSESMNPVIAGFRAIQPQIYRKDA